MPPPAVTLNCESRRTRSGARTPPQGRPQGNGAGTGFCLRRPAALTEANGFGGGVSRLDGSVVFLGVVQAGLGVFDGLSHVLDGLVPVILVVAVDLPELRLRLFQGIEGLLVVVLVAVVRAYRSSEKQRQRDPRDQADGLSHHRSLVARQPEGKPEVIVPPRRLAGRTGTPRRSIGMKLL
jgi:hypothetical protein